MIRPPAGTPRAITTPAQALAAPHSADREVARLIAYAGASTADRRLHVQRR